MSVLNRPTSTPPLLESDWEYWYSYCHVNVLLMMFSPIKIIDKSINGYARKARRMDGSESQKVLLQICMIHACININGLTYMEIPVNIGTRGRRVSTQIYMVYIVMERNLGKLSFGLRIQAYSIGKAQGRTVAASHRRHDRARSAECHPSQIDKYQITSQQNICFQEHLKVILQASNCFN